MVHSKEGSKKGIRGIRGSKKEGDGSWVAMVKQVGHVPKYLELKEKIS